MIIVFPIALVVYAVSGCDVRRRSDKHACRHGAAERCVAVGKFYESRTDGLVATLLSNAATAKDYYHRACELGNRDGCARFGHMVVVGSYDTIRDDGYLSADGMSALGKACDDRDLDACRELADAAEPAQAAPILAKLCDGGDKASCDKLVPAYLETDPKRAIELLTKLCDGGDNDHCRELGSAFLTGSKFVEADPPRAIALLTKACDRSAWGCCTQLGEAYLDGTLPADPARAAQLFAGACDHGDLDACFWQGKALIASDPMKAVQTFTAECDHDDRGCDALGDLYRVGPDGIARDRGRARAFYGRACRAGSEFDCHKLGCYDADSDDCYKVHRDQRERVYRLGGAFDM